MKSSRILKNAGVLMGMELGIRTIDALVSIVLARYLAPQGFGLLAFALSFAQFFSVLPSFGLGYLITRDIAQHPEHLGRYLSNGLAVKLALNVATFAIIGAVLLFSGFSSYKCFIVLFAAVLMISETHVGFFLSFFQASEEMGFVAVTNLAVRFGWLVLALAVVLARGGILLLLATRIFVTAIGFIAPLVFIQRRHRVAWKLELPFAWRMFKGAVPFVLSRLYGRVYMDIDTIMLSFMRGDQLTGWYASAQKFLRIFGFIPTGFAGALFPAMARAALTSKPDWRRMVAASVQYAAILGLPIAGGICILARPIVLLVYGPAYEQAIPILRILIWMVPTSFLNTALLTALASVHREKLGSVILPIAQLCSGLSNLIVIPLFSSQGAASTTLLADFSVLLYLAYGLRDEFSESLLVRHLRKPLAAVCVMMGLAWLASPWGLWSALFLASAAYVGCLLLVKAVDPADLRWLFVRVRSKLLAWVPQ